MTIPATIVLTSAVAWTGTRARPQHVAAGLAGRGWNVLFVDGPITWLSPLKNRELRQRLVPEPSVRQVVVPGPGSLRVLSPVATLPFGNLLRPINRVNQHILAEQIRRAAPGPYVLLPMLPGSVDLSPHLEPLVTIYDCVDLHAEFGGLSSAEVIYRMERDLVAQSRVVFATADALRERLARWHSDVRLIPNAAEAEHFARTPDLPEHALLSNIPRPRVGYIGGIGSWVDQGLIDDMAKARPDVHFVFVGPVETDVSRLRERSNIHFLGLQPYSELPRFLAGFDVAIHAFLRNELTQSVNPIKIYEYLASGKEVIATTSRELERLDSLLWLIDGPEPGLKALERILSGEKRTDSDVRSRFVEKHSWSARVDEVDRAIRSVVPPELRPARS